MNKRLGSWFLIFGVVVLLATFTVSANAGCGDFKAGAALHKQSFDVGDIPSGRFLLASDDADAAVGMWHVTFTAQGNDPGPPDGATIDNALVTIHGDGTEIMNSGRPAQDGQICMGVWKKTGRLRYKVNHIAWGGNDAANAPGGIGNPAGPTRIVENFTLSPDGKSLTGTFTLDAYDPAGNQVAHIIGTMSGTRVTINTTVEELL
jgi:hypothetical protein